MVAVVAGNGLGLGNTSLTQLGQSMGGQATLGQGQVGQYVNIATGNLILQNNDEGLIFDGLPLNVLRTYNSLGQMSGNQGWLLGFTRNVTGLVGTLNTAGSSITRVDDDGSSVTYVYDSTRGVYVSSGQSGAEDTVSWNASSSQWTWTDGSSRQQETYDADGQLIKLTDPATGASFSFNYEGGRLSTITSADGDTLTIGYDDAGRVSTLSLTETPPGQSTPVTRQEISYHYDAQNRLDSVTTTLASDTDTSGGTYTTSYTYDGSSDRIASMTQSDGTTVSFTYAEGGDGVYRVATVTTGTGADAQTITFNYTPGSDTTTLVNSLGQAWQYNYNAAGEITQVISPEVNGTGLVTQYAYDANGNVTQVTNPDNGVTTYVYDANGNRLSARDADGNVVAYTYNDDNQVLSKTVFTVPAQGVQGQPGYVPPSGAQTTYYVYDGSDRLNYEIDALGNVTQYTYQVASGGITVLSSVRQYLAAQYSLSGFGTQSPPTLTDLQNWASSSAVQATLAQTTLTAYTYDVRGQLATQTQWSTVDASGNGVTNASTSVTTTTYDAQGRLLQTVAQRDGVNETTSYAYDGLGRLLSSTDPQGNVTSYVYTDSANTIAVTQANGLVTTQVRNSAGELVSTTQSASGAISRTNTTLYNAAGEAVAAIDALGNVTYTFYDALGRVAGTVDGNGAVTAYTYNGEGQLVSATRSAAMVDTAGWIVGGSLSSSMPAVLPMPVATVQDATATTIYDAAGLAVATIDGHNDVTIMTYDGAGNLLSTTDYATPISATDRTSLGFPPSLVTLENLLQASADDRTTRAVYDADNRVVATIDAAGAVKTFVYDAVGNMIASRSYPITLTTDQLNALGSAPSIDQLMSMFGTDGYSIFDAVGHLVAQVDSSGDVVTFDNDASGNVTRTVTYGTPLTSDQMDALRQSPTMDTLAGFLAAATDKQTSLNVYDASGHLVATVDNQGTITVNTYDANGHLTASTVYANTLSETDVFDLGAAPLLTQVEADIVASPSDRTTLASYDDAGNEVATVSADGIVTTMTYDASGNQITRTVYANPLTGAQIVALGTSPAPDAILDDIVTSSSDQTSHTIYDTHGNALATIAANGFVTTYYYDGNGQVVTTTVSAVPLTADQMAALGSSPTVAQIQAYIEVNEGEQISLTIYDDQNRPLATILNGQVTVTSYDASGNPSVVTQYATPLTSDQELALMQAPSMALLSSDLTPSSADVVTMTVRDAGGRVVASVDSTECATITTYNADGYVTSVSTYATPLSAQDLEQLGSTPTLSDIDGMVVKNVNPNDQISLTVYDASDRIVASVNASGVATVNVYDAAGNVTSTTRYSNTIDVFTRGTLGASPTLAQLTSVLQPSALDQTIIFIYDASNRVVARVLPQEMWNYVQQQEQFYGDVTINAYGASGSTTSSQTASSLLTWSQVEALAANPTMDNLTTLLSVSGSPSYSQTIYDAQHRAVADIYLTRQYDPNIAGNYVVTGAQVATTTYDQAGNVVSTRSYANALSLEQWLSLGSDPTMASLQSMLVPSGLDTTTVNIYDASEHLIATVGSYGDVQTSTYDAAGSQTSHTNYSNYLTADQMATLLASPTLATLQSLLVPSATDHTTLNIFDVNERVVASVGNFGDVTYTNYDSTGNGVVVISCATALTQSQIASLGHNPSLSQLQAVLPPASTDAHVVTITDGQGHTVATVSRAGAVEMTAYDALGNATSSTSYYTYLTPSQLDALWASPSLSLLQSMVTPSSLDSVFYSLYDTQGNLIATVGLNGAVQTYAWNANGQIVASTQYVNSLNASQLAAFRANQTADELASLVTSSSGDVISVNLYDDSGRQVASVSGFSSYYPGSGYVYEAQAAVTSYDAQGDATQVTQYATELSTAQLRQLEAQPSLSTLMAMLNPDDGYLNSVTVYDANHRVVATVGANGDVTTTSYDASGNVTGTRSYAVALTTAQVDALGTSPTLASLEAYLTPSDDDVSTVTIYDQDERVIGQVAAQYVQQWNGYAYVPTYQSLVTTYTYDDRGNQTSIVHYTGGLTKVQVNALAASPSASSLAADLTSLAPDQATLTVYDASNRVIGMATTGYNYTYGNFIQLTTYAYDASGDLISTRTNTLYQYRAPISVSFSTLAAMAGTATLSQLTQLVLDPTVDFTAYDANHRPTIEVTNGRVVATTYDASGNVLSTIEYAEGLDASAVDALMANPSMDELMSIISPSDNDSISLTVYDDSENPVATLNPVSGYDSNGNWFDGYQLVTNTYDAAGNITSTRIYGTVIDGWQVQALGTQPTLEDVLDLVMPSDSDSVTLSVYDGQRRQIANVDANGHVTVNVYDDNGNQTSSKQFTTPLTSAQVAALGTAPTLAQLEAAVTPTPADATSVKIYDDNGNVIADIENGVVTTTSYDAMGNSVATVVYGRTLTPNQIMALGDSPTLADLRAIVVPSASDNVHVTILDGQGDILATIDPAGQVTTYTYDADSNEIGSTAYVNKLTLTQAEAVANAPTLQTLSAYLQPSSGDDVSFSIFDANGNTVAFIGNGEAAVYGYDDAGNLTALTSYELSDAQLAALKATPTPAEVSSVLGSSSYDSATLNVYDDAGRVVATLNSYGPSFSQISITGYDANGNVTVSQSFNAAVSEQQIQALGQSPTLAMLMDAVDIAQSGSVDTVFRDSAGRIVAEISPDGHVTTSSYDARGNLTASTAYSTPIAHWGGGITTLAQLMSQVQPSSGDQTTRHVYNADGSLLASIDNAGQVTVYGVSDAGTTLGTVAGWLTPTQVEQLGDHPSLADLQALMTPTTRAIYDAAGHQVVLIDADGNPSYSFYDGDGRLVESIDPVGYVTTYGYDADGNLIRTTQYASPVSTAGWISGGELSADYPASAPIPSASASDRVTQTIYDTLGQAVATIDAAGDVTTTSYDAFGHPSVTIRYAKPLSAGQRSSLGTDPSLSSLLDKVVPDVGDRTSVTIYDANDQLIASVTAEGGVTEYTYDGVGNLLSTIAYATPLGDTQLAALASSPSMAELGQLVQSSLSDQVSTNIYDSQDRVIASVDADGYLTVTSYDEAGHSSVTTRYDIELSTGQIASLTDAESVAALVATFDNDIQSEQESTTYNSSGEPATTIAADGTITVYTYDGDGDVTSKTVTPAANQGDARTVSYVYDSNGNVITSYDADNNETNYSYDAAGRLISVEDGVGLYKWLYYDADGRLAYTIQQTSSQVWGAVTAYTYDAFGDTTSSVSYVDTIGINALGDNPNGLDPWQASLANIAAAIDGMQTGSYDPNQSTTVTYTQNGQVASQTDGDGYETINSYDAFGDLVSTTRQLGDPNGPLTSNNSVTTSYSYDKAGRLTGELDGVGTSIARGTSSSYDVFGRMVSATDANGNVIHYAYDKLGRQISSSQFVQGVDRTSSTSYDAFGRTVTQTDALGNITAYSYDLANHAMTVTTPEGVAMTTVEDAFGDVVSVTDAQGNTVSYTYDSNGNLTSTTDALGNVSRDTYDADNNLLSTTDATGVEVDYTYDSQGRVLTRTLDPNGVNAQTSYVYDGVGRVMQVYDPLGSETSYYYDADGNVTSQVVSSDYGRLLYYTDYTYDGGGRVLTVTQHGMTPGVSSMAVAEGVGRASANGSNSAYVSVTTQYVYDQLGRLTQKIVDPSGLNETTTYAYDANDNVVEVTDANGDSSYTVYNEANEVVYTVSAAGAQGANLGAVQQNWYDADGRLVSSKSYSSLVATSSLSSLASQAPASNMATLASLVPLSSSDSATYRVYDTDGRLRFTIDALGNVTETRYNALGQVATTLSYATAISLNALGAAIQDGTAQISDVKQALSEAGDADANARASYSYYDADGRVAYTATVITVNGVTAVVVEQTQYDDAGRVSADIVYGMALPLSDVGSDATTQSIGDAVSALNTTATTRTTQYIYDSAGRNVATIDPNGGVRYTFYDADGNVVATVDATGAMVQYNRDDLGRVISQISYVNAVDTSSWLSNGSVTIDAALISVQADPENDRETDTTYDAIGRVSTVTTYAHANDQTQVYDPNQEEWVWVDLVAGNCTTYTYDAASNVVETVDSDLAGTALTRTTRYFYDARNQLIATLDANGYLTTQTLDAAGQVVSTTSYATATDAALRPYGTLAQLLPDTTSKDRTTSTYFDARGNVIGILDADGYFTSYSYDLDDQRTGSTRYATSLGEAGATYDELVEQSSTSPSQQTSCTYDSFGDRLTETDTRGTVTQYVYDQRGRVIQTTVAEGTSQARSTKQGFDAFGNLISTTDGIGNITTYTYDLNGNRVSMTDAMGNTTWYAYDADNRLAATVMGMADASGQQNALGNIRRIYYDTFGDVSNTYSYGGQIAAGYSAPPSLTDINNAMSAGMSSSADQVGETDYHYDLMGNVVTKNDGNDNAFNYQYDGFGELILSDTNNSQYLTTFYTYDAMGHMTSQIDETNTTNSSGDGEFFARMAVNGGCGGCGGSNELQIFREQDWAYDAFGDTVSYTDGDRSTTTYSYDNLGQGTGQSQMVQGAARQTSVGYDAYGRVISQTDAMGLITRYAYDDAARTMTVTAPGGFSTTTSFNREGQAVKVVDPAGGVTSYQYDADGRLLATTQADGGTVSQDYDADGDVTRQSDADGHVVTYTYDAAGKVLTQTVDPDGLALVTTYAYSGRELLVSVTDPNGVVTTYAHDGNGNVNTSTITGNGTDTTTNYWYNNLNELTRTNSDGNNGDETYTNVSYDALGRVTESDSSTSKTATNYVYDADGRVIAKTVGASTTLYYYDEAGEQVYAISSAGGNGNSPGWWDGQWPSGAVTQTWYNADGQIVGTRQYQNLIDPITFESLYNSAEQFSPKPLIQTPDQVSSLVNSSAEDRMTYQVYNAAGQLQYSIDPAGVVTELRYNPAGQVAESLVYANPISVSSALSSALLAGTADASSVQTALSAAGDSDATARASFMYYDAMGRVRFNVDMATLDGVSGGLVTETLYDADGNMVSSTRFGSLVSSNLLGTDASTASIASAVSGSTSQETVHYAYDHAGRLAYEVDPDGDVIEHRYDADGNEIWTLQYAHAIDPLGSWDAQSVAAAVSTANPDVSTARVTGKAYDGAGNVVATYDSLTGSPVATYLYDGAGRKLSYTNQDGQTWSYQYDNNGNLVEEISPPVAVASYVNGVYQGTVTRSIVTEYEYDQNGNLRTQNDDYSSSSPLTTSFLYDDNGNLISATSPDGQTSRTVYDAFNQAVVSQDANGNTAYNVYDPDGRLAYSVDAEGYVTGYQYDAYGDQTSVTRYADAIDTSTLTNWAPGDALSLSQLQSVLVTSSSDRTIATTYDSLGNKVSVTQPAVTYTKNDGTTAIGSPVTTYTYNAYGNVTSQSMLVQGTPGQTDAVWATTFNYYDGNGNKTMSVDPMGYVTTWTYDAEGEVTNETQWATAISTAGLVAGGAQPANPPPGDPATTGYDRLTNTTYDKDGNKASVAVSATYVDGSGATVHGFSTTIYGYDGEGRPTTVTQNGQTVTTAYDALGRVISITGPGQQVLVSNWQQLLAANPALDLTSPSLYTTAQQVITYTYDAFGNKLTQTQSSTVGGTSITSYFRYDGEGRLIASVTPVDGHTLDWGSSQAVFMTYDANGNLLTTTSSLDGDDGTSTTVTVANTYDASNQLLSTVTTRGNAATPDKSVYTQYDAFGEVIATGDGVVVSQSTTYDNGGNVLTSNDPKTGEVHTYGYNLAGQKVSDTVPLAASVGGTVSTINTLDLDGRVIAKHGASTNSASGMNSGALEATYDRWGNVLSSTDALGYTTSYTYNERNQVTQTTEAVVTIVADDGSTTDTTPIKTSSYDINGNLVSATDENGNTARTYYNALGQAIETVDGAGAVSYVAYDALGREVADENGNGNVTFKNLDVLGRIVQEGDFVLSSDGTSRAMTWRQAYVLDQNGNELISYDGIGAAYLQSGDTTDAALHANYYGYDSQNRILWSQDAAQRAASINDGHGGLGDVGSWTQQPTNSDFSQGATGWVAQGNWSFGNFGSVGVLGFATGATWSAQFSGTNDPSGEGYLINTDRVPVIAGQTITAKGTFEVNGEHGGGSVIILWYDANGNQIPTGPNGDIVSAHHGAGVSTYTSTAPAGAVYAAIGISATTQNTAGAVVLCSSVSWDYVPPAGATSTNADGSIVVWLPNGSFTQQPSNPDFENGDTGWDKDPGWSIHTQSNTSNGQWVASYNGVGPATLTNQNRVPVTAGQSISASAQVSLYLAPDGAEASAGIEIQWYDASGNLIGTSAGNVVSTDHLGQYNTSRVTGTAPPGAAFATVAVAANANGIGSAVVDAVVWNYQYIPSSPQGVVQDSYVYDLDGNLVSETTADGDTETWEYNAYGQVTRHTDLSGAVYTYTYDSNTGAQIAESDNWSAQSQGQQTPSYVTGPISTPNSSTSTYYADGQLATQTFSDGSVYTYHYDANGNVISQESITVDGNGQAIDALTTTTYNTHNEIAQVTQTNVLTGAVGLVETIGYDAAGNRREVKGTSNGTTQDAWYTYDGDNRVEISAGTLTNGKILISSDSNSFENVYDADGNVTYDLTVNASGDHLSQRNYYDSRDELIRADYAIDLDKGGASKGIEESRTYDADGHVLITQTYYSLGTVLGARPAHQVDPNAPQDDDGDPGTDVGGFLDTAVVDYYDSVGRLAEEQNFSRPTNWDGTGSNTLPNGAPGEDATSFGSLGLQNEVVYQGTNGTAGYDADGDVVAYQYRDASGRVDQYAITYLRKDGYLQSTTSGVNISDTPNVRPTTDESVYDTRGDLVALAEHTQYAGGTVQDTVHVFAYDGNGEIIERRDGTATGATLDQGSTPAQENQHYVYVNGQQLAHFDDSGTLDVLTEVTAFSSGSNGPNGYVVQAGDTLESIAQAEYGNSSLWYVIASANALGGDSQLSLGQRLTIPQVTTTSNTAATFKPYDPSSIVGSTTPNLPVIAPPPPPPSQHCNTLAMIVIIAVTVVATIVTYGATSELLGAELGGMIAAGAAAGAAGSIAGQLTGMALGVQKGFDWGQVAEGAIGGAITGGVASELSSTGSVFASSTAADGLTWEGDLLQGAANYVSNDIAAQVTGEPEHFSWAGLVAASVGNAVAGSIGPSLVDSNSGMTIGNYGENLAARAAGDIVTREVGVALGDHHVSSWEQIGEDVAGHALGNAAVIGIRSYQAMQRQKAVAALNDEMNQSLSDEIAKLNNDVWGNVAADADADTASKGQAALDEAWSKTQAAYDEQTVSSLKWPDSLQDNTNSGASGGATGAVGASNSVASPRFLNGKLQNPIYLISDDTGGYTDGSGSMSMPSLPANSSSVLDKVGTGIDQALRLAAVTNTLSQHQYTENTEELAQAQAALQQAAQDVATGSDNAPDSVAMAERFAAKLNDDDQNERTTNIQWGGDGQSPGALITPGSGPTPIFVVGHAQPSSSSPSVSGGVSLSQVQLDDSNLDVASITLDPPSISVPNLPVTLPNIDLPQLSPPGLPQQSWGQMAFHAYQNLSSSYQQSEKDVESAGDWVNNKVKQAENWTDSVRANIVRSGLSHGPLVGNIALSVAQGIGRVEGAGLETYGTVSGLVRLSYGAVRSASPMAWALDPVGNAQRTKSALDTLDTLNNLASPEMWAINPKGNYNTAKAIVLAATANYRADYAKGDYSKLEGRGAFQVLTATAGLIGKVGKIADGAEAVNAAAKAGEVSQAGADAVAGAGKASGVPNTEAPFSPIVDGGGLQAHEDAGGHLLEKHVGQSEQDLVDRLAAEPNISGSSSFYDRATAENAVSQTIDANQQAVTNWLNNGSSGRLRLDYSLSDPVGISVSRGATSALDVNSARVILVRDASMPTGYKILTGFPTKP